MAFFKRHWEIWLTLAFFAVLPFLNLDNFWLALLVILFLFPFTRRGFIAKVLLFIDVAYYVLLAGLIVLSLLVPNDAPLFNNTLYVGLVLTAWSWVYRFLFSGVVEAVDDDDERKAKIVYFVLLIATPFVCSAVASFASGVFETILKWIVGLTSASSVVMLFSVFRGEGMQSNESKTPSLSLVQNAAIHAALSCYCEVARVQTDRGKIIIFLEGARSSYGNSNVAQNFMNQLAKNLSGYDLSDIQIRY